VYAAFQANKVVYIAALHIKHYTGRSEVSRGDLVGQRQTGEA